MSIEQRNAYYKGTLAARKGKNLSDVPEALNSDCIGMWIAGFNVEKKKIEEHEAEMAMIANML